MTYNWNTQFEAQPSGGDFAYTMGSGLRDTKAAFKERIEVEHTFDESSSAIIGHKPGECSIVNVVDGMPVSFLKQGALHLDSSAKVLYYDTGTAVSPMFTYDHTQLEGLSDDDHTQYFKIDGSDTVTGTVSIDDIEGIGSNSPPDEDEALTYEVHINVGYESDADHVDGILDAKNVSFNMRHLNLQEETITFNPDDEWKEVDLGDLASFPIPERPESGDVEEYFNYVQVNFRPITSSESFDKNGRMQIRVYYNTAPITLKYYRIV